MFDDEYDEDELLTEDCTQEESEEEEIEYWGYRTRWPGKI